MVDIGDRRLRVVRAGPASDRPTVVLEHGAFGCAADWAVVQARLAAKGLASIAYDRAGLGHSEPGPKPRDGRAIVADLAALLRALDEEGPFVLAGHSMGGLMVRLYALTHPDQVLGVVMVDAVTPDVISHPIGEKGVYAFTRILGWASEGAKFGMMRPVAAVAGDRIGLPPAASAEKRRIHGSAGHAHWAAEEVGQWRVTSDQARAGDFPAAMPIAVITAGAENTVTALKEIQSAPALASQNGYIEHVAGAGHANLLGRRFADPIVRGVEHVLATTHR
ncbi:MAG: alpha/beta fold hydrolase [Caulobacterales bacterium]|jgi:pimeloyl-ACP methyl ester carboxylesterase